LVDSIFILKILFILSMFFLAVATLTRRTFQLLTAEATLTTKGIDRIYKMNRMLLGSPIFVLSIFFILSIPFDGRSQLVTWVSSVLAPHVYLRGTKVD
jgi:hypothetical protein